MKPFKLVSDFEPKGDQPEAIKELSEGVLAGKKHQTLLGVTGSGKSLDYDEPVLVYRKKGDSFIPHIYPIGRFVDKRLEERHEKGLGSQWYTLSFNPEDCSSSITPIDDYLRHEAPSYMWEILTECGREALMTGDHNLWVLRDGKLRLIETSELEVGDYIPFPRDVTSAEEDLKSFDVLHYLMEKEVSFYIQAPTLIEKLKNIYGRGAVLKCLKELYPTGYASKLRSIERCLKGGGFRAADFFYLIRSLDFELSKEDYEGLVLHCRGPYRLPSTIPLSDDLLWLLGMYVAEGHATDRYVTFSIRERPLREMAERIFHNLDLTFSCRPAGDYQISNKIITAMLSQLCGYSSWNKRLPFFWSQLSRRQIGVLLGAYFDGDGGVEDNQVVCVTASRTLASDLLYAFSFLGIWARSHTRFKRATNTDHEGNLYKHVTVSGGEHLRIFRSFVVLQLKRKLAAIDGLLLRKPHSNVDVIPVSPVDFRTLRQKCSYYMTEVEGLSHSAISMFESGKRRPKRDTLEHILAQYESGLPRDDESWHLLNGVKNLLSLRWTRVSQFGRVKYDKKNVYDLSVPGNETFLAGRGGLFVHNTFSVAHLIANVNKPTLVMAPNKTLAAQLYSEFKELFPENAVEYFVSYYDYYQPEAYMPAQDLYIEKDSDINEQIDKLRHSATHSLLTRRDVIIVASVSCIYGLGSPEAYESMMVKTERGATIDRQRLLRRLIDIQYQRNDHDFHRGTFRVRGDVVEVIPSYEDARAVRFEFFGDELTKIVEIDSLSGRPLGELSDVTIFPGSHYVTTEERMKEAIDGIRDELRERLQFYEKNNQPLERARIEQRTMFDLEMMEEMGTCKGIENYSRYLTGRAPGDPPPTLIEYFPSDFLLVIDESHITVPQTGGMYNGDRARKSNLVEYGFRLPSALDNRPLRFDEFERLVNQTVYISATPADYELKQSEGEIVEQIIRPTGLIDPVPEVRPAKGQVDDLLIEIRKRVAVGERVLVTTLTKRMSEELTDFLREHGIRVRYLHSDIESLERIEILRALRMGEFDVLVGINLLREGLDLPEVSLVAILDADREGFLRSTRSLIQTFGRAARNVKGTALLYGDRVTDSMRRAIDETIRRRKRQEAYNREHGITPKTIEKKINDVLHSIYEQDYVKVPGPDDEEEFVPREKIPALIKKLERKMLGAAKKLEFEEAAGIRDRIVGLREKEVGL